MKFQSPAEAHELPQQSSWTRLLPAQPSMTAEADSVDEVVQHLRDKIRPTVCVHLWAMAMGSVVAVIVPFDHLRNCQYSQAAHR
eukprot:CAMPEP_0181521426 /NCGR_PEP_ID=MMETSP1110-20121109/66834_1 /TAXON_ID=174948 /ORGANISM="Symbiodinium sp., Strain CCMP421" /LENGTH=83 /DNA_ID=CAMNT_0023651975 /DNA_START=40 /DNA_END=290 /DNA_ORIENTATION=+